MPENTKTSDGKPRANLVWIAFALIIVVVYFTGLTIPLVGPDEPRYAQVAREMFLRGDWVTPTLGGFDWFEKPALLYWLEIVSYKIFGVSEFAARCGSAIFGLLTAFSLWIIGKAATGEKTANDFPNWLAVVAASSIGLIVFSRGASFDIILTFPVTAALTAFFIFDRRVEQGSAGKNAFAPYPPLFFFYFFVGVALIAKGLVGIVFPFAIVGLYHLLARRMPSKMLIASLFWGTVLSLLVASVWYWPMYRANGWKFIDEFIIQHHFQRYTSNKYQHPQPFYFFFWVLPLMTLPWLPFFLAAIWRAVKGIFKRKTETVQPEDLPFSSSPLLLFSTAWLLVPLAFFSLSGSKLPGYILPALPAALVLTATEVWRFAARSQTRRIALQTTAFLMLAGIVVAAKFFIAPFLHEETVKHLIDTANSKGYTSEKILNLHTLAHSAEFYGAGRLLREPDGKQKRLYGVSEVIAEMKQENTDQTLVLIPLVYLSQLTKSDQLDAQVLDDNGDLAIVLVRLK
ncbi:MAG: glycosyltransferase family 39 protein [Acidobacteria bacterium]|nr:glycosyltransferase family 39 protein [Acidobacteriota bacterium]